jgi:hypothetical protein
VRATFSPTITAVQQDRSVLGPGGKVFLYWTLALELGKHSATRDLAFTAFEALLNDSDAWLLFRFVPNVSTELPVRQLVPLALQTGRREQARRALLGFARAKWPDVSYTDEIVTVMHAIGASLLELGYAADALPLLRDAQNLAARADLSLAPTTFPNLPEMPRLIEEHLKSAAEQMSPSDLATIALRSIADAAEKPVPSKPGIAPTDSAGDRGAPLIDLMTTVNPRSLEKASVQSMMADSLGACDPAQLKALAGSLETLRHAHPEDLSVATCVALSALASNDGELSKAALERLAQLVENTPLDTLTAGARANARERAQAAAQIPLWLVARAARGLEAPSLRAHADHLAARALEAAARQDDSVWLLAMLREQGELAFDQHDRANAAAVWSRMLDLVVTPPDSKARRPAAIPGRSPSSTPAPARTKATVPAGF